MVSNCVWVGTQPQKRESRKTEDIIGYGGKECPDVVQEFLALDSEDELDHHRNDTLEPGSWCSPSSHLFLVHTQPVHLIDTQELEAHVTAGRGHVIPGVTCALSSSSSASVSSSSVVSTGAALEVLLRAESAWDQDLADGCDAQVTCMQLPRNPPLPLEDLIAQFRSNSGAPVLDLKHYIDSRAAGAHSNYTMGSKRRCGATSGMPTTSVSALTPSSPEDEFVHALAQKLARYSSYYFVDSSEQDHCDKIRLQEIAYRFGKTDFH